MKRVALASVRRASRVAVLAAGLAAVSVAQGDVTRLPLVQPVRVRLEGRSNMGAWSCHGTAAHGAIVFEASRDRVLSAAASLSRDADSRFDLPMPEFEMRIPVESLRCGNRRMERDLRRAVDAAAHPDIVFRFVGLGESGSHTADDRTSFRVRGRVTLSGSDREVEVPVLANRLQDGRYRARTELPLQMTWFGVTPPVGFFGLIRAEDSLRVGLDVTVALDEEPLTP